MGLFENLDFDGHEAVHFVDDEASGLRVIIAIHSTALGPAAGGCRLWHYQSSDEALTDVLRLARGMSLKNALAGLPLGGGKAVILKPSEPSNRTALFAAFGRAVESLHGRYITAEDVGTRVADMLEVSRHTQHVSGLAGGEQRAGGDPSPKTALGVYLSMKEAWAFATGSRSLRGVRVAVQGCGVVGAVLCRHLFSEGAILVVADVTEASAQRVAKVCGATVVPPVELITSDVDILAPCAMGGVLDAEKIVRLRARLICGAANNQLARADDGDLLRARNVLYAPDYVVNAGGIISAGLEYLRASSARDVLARIEAIPHTLRKILEISAAEGVATSSVADRLALERIRTARVRECERQKE